MTPLRSWSLQVQPVLGGTSQRSRNHPSPSLSQRSGSQH